jgi:hypothetical protein
MTLAKVNPPCHEESGFRVKSEFFNLGVCVVLTAMTGHRDHLFVGRGLYNRAYEMKLSMYTYFERVINSVPPIMI